MTPPEACPKCQVLWDPGRPRCWNCGHDPHATPGPEPEPARRLRHLRRQPPADNRDADSADDTPAARTVRLADIEPEHVDWLWDRYLPLGKVTVLDGDPGIGKSTVAVDLAARVSSGAPMPDGTPGRAGSVLVLSAEDGLADTIRPRLDAAGGDPAAVLALTGFDTAGEDGRPFTRPPVLPGDIPAIEDLIRHDGVLLVIVDVLMAYLAAAVDSYRDQDVRRALAPLAAMAERTGSCVLVLRHLSKSGGQHAVYRGGGSIGIIGAARAAFVCGMDPGDDTGRTRVLAPSKVNLSQWPASLAYTLEPAGGDGCARVEWHGESGLRAAALLTEPETPDERSERDEAAEWLTAWLAGHGGKGSAGQVIRAAAKDGIARTTLHRARRRAGITTSKDGLNGPWLWCLPAEGSTKVPLVPGSENQEPTEPSGTFGDGPAAPCTVCGQPLSPVLAANGDTTHPNCDPEGTS